MKILYIVNNCAFFVSHRLALAIAAREAGFDVRLLTGRAGSVEMESAAVSDLKAVAVQHNRVAFTSAGINPFLEIFGLLQLVWLIFRHKPDLVHCASPKAVLYGGIAARLCRVAGLVLAISGKGYAYTDGSSGLGLRRLVRWVYGILEGLAFRHPNVCVIVQNSDDYQLIVGRGLVKPHCVTLIPGSGVDLSLFTYCESQDKERIVLLPARMLKDKGVEEFVTAARSIKALEPGWRFLLAGAASYDNPSVISAAQLQDWQKEGCVEWVGHIVDMVPLYRKAAIVCLPSYREGMPKVLLEAAAAGCAVVTTDVTGCREAVLPGVTGDLVPMKNSGALTSALLSLIKDDARRLAYGANGKVRAHEHYSIESVIQQTLNLYKVLLRHE